jgi:transcriptional regulator with XRE-family HTH domain
MNTSQRARSFSTLLAQMADLERGQRIRELRVAKHLTQPAAAELAGVTLRAYQAWEAGGGIRFEHVKTLASALEGDADFILNGPKPATPDPFTGGAAGVVMTRLDRLEAKLDAIFQILQDRYAWETNQPADEQAARAAEAEAERIRQTRAASAQTAPARRRKGAES